MPTLHLVFHAPCGREAPAWFGRLRAGDAVLLLGDALHGIRANGPWRSLIPLAEGTKFYALKDDLLPRGIQTTSLPGGLGLLDDAGFVALAVEHTVSVTWS
jgi:sulfur relay protein TusB/DsrH